MEILLDINSHLRFVEVNLFEKELQQHIIKNRAICFPNFLFIKQEFIESTIIGKRNSSAFMFDLKLMDNPIEL